MVDWLTAIDPNGPRNAAPGGFLGNPKDAGSSAPRVTSEPTGSGQMVSDGSGHSVFVRNVRNPSTPDASAPVFHPTRTKFSAMLSKQHNLTPKFNSNLADDLANFLHPNTRPHDPIPGEAYCVVPGSAICGVRP
jgi:hypothetical protein